MPQATFATCPKCGAKVRKEKLRRHISGVHGATPKPPKADAGAVAARPASTVVFPWKVIVVLAVVAAVIGVGYYVLTLPPAGPGGGGGAVAVMVTNYGTIRITLATGYGLVTPTHFMDLVNAHKYDGSSFHRVAWNVSQDPQHIWVIQGGAVSGATTVPWESTPFRNVKYSISMARSGDPNSASSKDTATSQFFINLKDDPALDPHSSATGLGYTYAYVVFGHIEDAASQAVVDAIGQLYPSGQTGYDGPPTNPGGTQVAVSISSVTMAS